MSYKPENPAAFACSRCGIIAARKQGHQWLCARHYRFGQMRARAKRDGKSVPTHEQLENIATLWCGDCGCAMNWLAKDDQTTVVTLQHYRDGTYGMVCRSCNTRHAFMPGDTYRDMGANNKLCAKCNRVQPLTAFYKDASRSGVLQKKSRCRECSDAETAAWRIANREKYNAYQREWRAMLAKRGSNDQ